MKIATGKVWVDSKGKLVADGDEDAQILFAIPGQEIADKEVEAFKNADDFFEDAKKHEASEENHSVHKKAHHK